MARNQVIDFFGPLYYIIIFTETDITQSNTT